MFETLMVLLAPEPNKFELVSKRSIAVRARVLASGKRSSSAAPASANASAPFCNCVCRLITLAPSSASTDRPTMTTSIIVTYGRIIPLVSFQRDLRDWVRFWTQDTIEHIPARLMHLIRRSAVGTVQRLLASPRAGRSGCSALVTACPIGVRIVRGVRFLTTVFPTG